jgi:hypothetical protein
VSSWWLTFLILEQAPKGKSDLAFDIVINAAGGDEAKKDFASVDGHNLSRAVSLDVLL